MRYFFAVLAVFAAELGIKNRVEANGVEGQERPAAGGLLILKKFHNDGAFLGLGKEKKKWVAVCSVTLTLFVAVLFVLSLGTKGNVLLRSGLSLLLGGAFSNTYDRLKRGYVVDYFSIGIPVRTVRNVVFNLSDFCIMLGALIACLAADGAVK